LYKEKDHSKTYLDIAGIMIVVLDTEGKVTFINPRGCEILGYEAGEIIGKNWYSNFLPERIAEEALHVSCLILNGEGESVAQYENAVLTKSGKQKIIIWNNVELRDETGRIIGTLSYGEDITARKQAEKRLERAAHEWRTTFDSIPDIIAIQDKDSRLLRVNKAMADLLKTTPKELIGKFCYQVMHCGKEPPANCPHLKTLKTGKPAVIEILNPDFEIYFHESTSPMFNGQGEVISSVLVARDMTREKRLEEQLIVTDRLASIGELYSGIAHELNNPLTGVISYSKLLMEGDVPDDIKNDLALISSEAQRAVAITKNLLTFARKPAPAKELSQINTVIADVLRLRAYEQKVNNIEVETHLGNLPEIMMNPFQMQQVFLNIIVNAEFAMLEAHQKGKLVITTSEVDADIRIVIADDGPGITGENLKHIFDPFFTTKKVGMGTGLGLSICHAIITEHNGKIYARSEKRQGAAFIVELPLHG